MGELPDDVFDKVMGSIIPILSQHFLGGMLCLPAIFGLGVPREAAVALVRHGALVELGWEIQDSTERLYERFFTADGRRTQPNGLLFSLFTHHAMQWALVIPMNLYYSELSGYHELVFMLEGASSIAALVGIYGYTLDTSDRSQLQQMVVMNAFNLAIMVYTRFVHYWWSVFKCLSYFYAEGSYGVLAAGLVCGCFLMPSFAMSFIPQQWAKLVKFTQMYMENGSNEVVGTSLPALLRNRLPFQGKQTAAGKDHAE